MVQEWAPHGTDCPNAAKMRSLAMGWGTFFTVQHTLDAIMQLADMGPWDHFINLSGADYPARPLPTLTAYLGLPEHRQLSFIKYGVFPSSLEVRLRSVTQ
jgi:hypothetical protein